MICWETSRWLLQTRNQLLFMQYQGNLPQLRRPQSTEESLVDQTAIYIEDCVGHGGSAWPAWTVAKSRHGDHPTVRMVIFQRISRTGGSDDGDFVADLTHRQRWVWRFDVQANPARQRFIPSSDLGVARSGNTRREATRAHRKSIDSVPDWANDEPSALAMPFEQRIRDCYRYFG
jgi:hypothetical protein